MNTILQVTIGLSPLLLVSIIFLIRRKLIALPLITTLACLGILVFGIFAWRDTETAVEKEKAVISAGDYLYLAENCILIGDFDGADLYLEKMYLKTGDSIEGILCSARITALKGDIVGAGVLYAKLEKQDGGTELMTAADKEIYNAYQNGEAMDPVTAAGELAALDYLEESGADLTDYGYTEDDIRKLEKAAEGLSGYKDELIQAVEDDMDDQASENEDRYDALEDAMYSADIIEEEYDKYKNNNGYSEDELKKAYKDLEEIFKEMPDIFIIAEIDDAYVKALVVLGKEKELAIYADTTDSQKALVAVAQLVINGEIKEKDFPEGFVTLSREELALIIEQCNETLTYLKEEKNLDGADYKELKDKADTVKDLKDNMLLAELDSRIDGSSVPIDQQSQIYLGNSTINYATGNTDAGDRNFGLSMDTYQYSDDAAYIDAFNQISKVVNDMGDDNDVVNVGDYIEDAYSHGIISKNENDYDEDNSTSALEIIQQQGTTYVSKIMAMINISGIDISNFPEVAIDIQTAEKLDLNNLQLILNDCNVNIDDFTITKNNYNSAKLYVVCDKSGSMEGSTDLLQAAVRSLAESMSSKEKIALVAFSDSVEFASDLTDNPEDLEEYIVKLVANGGTNIASGAFYALEQLKDSKDSFNVIILMTDGEDSSFYDSRLEELASMCLETNTIVYTIGLGSYVSPEYLERIADYGGGKFVYCYNAAELESLYAFIHSQMENSYHITFTAKDTVTNYRTLTITNNADGTTATKNYTLGLDNGNTDENGEFVVGDGKISIDGFINKKIYKSDSDVKATIMGSGFAEDMTCSVSIKGDAYKGSLSATYVSESRFEVVVPAQIPAGQYEVTIIIGGCAVSDKIEILIPGKFSTIEFGAYTFSALSITEKDGVVTLSGDVSMNDFLHFYGDVTLSGDVEKDLQITLNDINGYYISFTKKLPGLLGKMCGNNLSLPSLGNLVLYNDKAHMDDLDEYMVEEYSVPVIKFAALNYAGVTLGLYPHKLSMSIENMTFDFPLQEQIFKYNGWENPFELPVEVEGLINASGLYVKGEAKASDLFDSFDFTVLTLGLDELALEFDTFNHDYKLTMKVKTEELIPKIADDTDDASYGFDISFKGGRWDGFNIYADFPILLCAEPPVSISGFFAGVEDLASQEQGSGFAKVLANATYHGGCDISLFKIADIIPALKPIFNDLSIITLSETTVSLRPANFKLAISSTAKLFGEIECANAEIQIGHYDYSDYLLGIDQEVRGLSVELSQGPVIDTSLIDITVQGTSCVDISDKLTAFASKGNIDYDINLIKHLKNQIEGTFELAFVDYEQCTLIIHCSNIAENSEAGVKLVIDGLDSYVELY
ncbi:MAG: VWA domain-containing protein [Lachnospiraceae bacterium]